MAPDNSPNEILEPSAAVCLGRDTECGFASQVPFNEGAGFLFGGRQMGKTTVLLKVRDDLLAQLAAKPPISVVPIYISRKALPPLDDHGLCKTLLIETQRCCAEHLPGLDYRPKNKDCSTILELASELDTLFAATEALSLRLLFLLDDCKKLAKLHPDFVGNLQWLLCNRSSKYRSRVSMIFAGGQEMYSLLLDEISPPRPALIYLNNLELDDLEELVATHPVNPIPARYRKDVAAALEAATGGHPGLSRALLVELARSGAYTAARLKQAISQFAQAKQDFFDRIRGDLSPEAACIQPLLLARRSASRAEVLAFVQTAGQNQYKSGRFLPELRFAGITRHAGDEVSAVGRMYWEYCAQFAPSTKPETAHHTEENKFIFKKDGAGWLLAFNGAPLGNWRHPKGLQRIHRLLKEPRKQIDVIELAQDGELAGDDLAKNKAIYEELQEGQPDHLFSGQPRVRTRSPKQLNIDLSKLNQRIHELEEEYQESTDRDAKDTLEESINKLKRQHQQGQEELESLDLGRSKSAYNAVRKSIFSESIPEISKRLPDMAKHLKGAIKPEGYTYRYTPDPAINWLLL